MTVTGEFGERRGRRSAAAAGVQQSVPQCARGVRRRATSRRGSCVDGVDRSGAGHAADHRERQRSGCRPGASRRACSGRSSRPRRAGTGLGLALVQKIIVTHNGRVSAVERRGRRRPPDRHPAASRRLSRQNSSVERRKLQLRRSHALPCIAVYLRKCRATSDLTQASQRHSVAVAAPLLKHGSPMVSSLRHSPRNAASRSSS